MNTEELKQWLIASGFHIAPNPVKHDINDCPWYAYRRTKGTVDCQCNDKPPSLCITPFEFYIRDQLIQSVEVSIIGEQDVWWNLKAYSLSYDTLKDKLPTVESQLVRAWNALTQTV